MNTAEERELQLAMQNSSASLTHACTHTIRLPDFSRFLCSQNFRAPSSSPLCIPPSSKLDIPLHSHTLYKHTSKLNHAHKFSTPTHSSQDLSQPTHLLPNAPHQTPPFQNPTFSNNPSNPDQSSCSTRCATARSSCRTRPSFGRRRRSSLIRLRISNRFARTPSRLAFAR
jgi:hypothetical protein